MKNKKISKLVASILTATVTLNFFCANAITVFANPSNLEEASSSSKVENSDNISEESNDLSELSGVSIEEMQEDFESISNAPSTFSAEEEKAFESNKDSENFIYLSDLTHDPLTYSQWNSIKNDYSSSGSAIHLLVNGIETVFDKGIGVDTDAKIVYNIGDYSDTFVRLVGYVGVDARQSDKIGTAKVDGVDFSIEVSNDGQQWEKIQNIGIKLPNEDAYKLDVNIAGYKYLRLNAMCGPNEYRSYDHAVFGDIRIVTQDYDISSENYTGFKTLQEYDAEISSRSVEDNYENYKHEVLEREFVNRVGYENIQRAAKYVDGTAEALDWLRSDENALQLFIEAGGYFSGNGYNALAALGKLYKEYKADMSNIVYKKMLLGTAAAYSKDIKTFLVNYGGNCVGANPVETYKNFKTLYNSNQFVRKSEFESYPMELVRAVMDSRINYDEMLWLRDYIEKKYPSETDIDNWLRYNGYGYANYVNTGYGKAEFYDENYKQQWDEKYDFLKYGISYGKTNLYRIWMFMEAGAICWGLSGLGMVVNELQGIPAIGTYQPGHEAYLLYSQDSQGKGIWKISDDIAGWGSSFSRWGTTTQTEHRLMLGWGQMDYNKLNGGNNTSYTLLAQDALNDYDNYLNSMFYNLIANSYTKGSEQHESALNQSLTCYSKNLDAMYGLYKSYLVDESKTDKEWVELAKKVATEYRYFPAPMVDLLNLIKAQVDDEILKISIDMMQTESLNKASVATSAESLQNSACQQIAKSLLGENSKELASFSFDGDNANTILINESYANSTIQVRVSLDNGQTWEEFENGQKFTTSHSIKLTDEQVSRINSTDNILVGLMGVAENFTIDIKDGTTITNSILFKNDLENRLIGDIDRLEYTENDGQNWHDYTSNTRFPSDTDRVVKVRYKAKGVYLPSAIVQYTFTADTDTDTRKYITIDHLSIHSFSSQVNSDKATNIIDGNDNTGWHNDSSKEPDASESRSVVIKLDEVKYISALEYYSAYNNGKIKSAKIYTSLDGENWVEVGSCSGWANDATVKKLNLSESSPARYVKIVATETHGSPINTFLTCRTLNLFEDTTKTYVSDVSIDYSITSPTCEDVTATLVLPKGCEVIGESEYVFEDNGTFEFKYTDANGIEQSIEAEVTWIDKVAPTACVEYNTDFWTCEDVIATLVDLSEEVTILNSEVVNNSYTFKDNGDFTFEFVDEAGNKGEVVAKVNWIDRTKPEEVITFSEKVETQNSVEVTLNIDTDEVEILNNDGSETFTFVTNGVFTFKLRLKSTGYEFEIPVKVDWIKSDTNTGEDTNVEEDNSNTGEEDTNVEEDNSNTGEEDTNVEEDNSNIGSEEDSNVEEDNSNTGTEEDSNVEEDNSNTGTEEGTNIEEDNSNVGSSENTNKVEGIVTTGSNNNQFSSSNIGNLGNVSLDTTTSSKNEDGANNLISFDESNNSEEEIVSNDEVVSSSDEEVSNKDKTNTNMYALGISLVAILISIFLLIKKSYFLIRKK